MEVLVVEEPVREGGGGQVAIGGPAECEQDTGELAFTKGERLTVAEYLQVESVGVR